MELGKHRKAQVYSLIAVLLTIPVMLFIAYYVTESQNIRYGSLEKVLADQIHEVESSIEKDYEQAMSISGKRAFLAATDYVIRNGSALDNASVRMEELMTSGTLYGQPVLLMHDNTIPEWISNIESLELGFNVDISYSDPVISDADGVVAKLTTTLDINVSDNLGIGSIDRSIKKDALISLTGIEDPIFPLNTLGFVSRSIKAYPYPYHAIEMATGSGYGSCEGEITLDPDYSGPDKDQMILVTDDATGISGFLGVVGQTSGIPAVTCHLIGTGGGVVDFVNSTILSSGYTIVNIDNESGGLWSLPIREAIEEGYYSSFSSGGGPGIMKRLEEDLSWTSIGMESFVNKEELQERGMVVKANQVSIDYLYFSENTVNGQSVRGLTSSFKIDAANAARYNLTGLM
jgi:hypothetical protein